MNNPSELELLVLLLSLISYFIGYIVIMNNVTFFETLQTK